MNKLYLKELIKNLNQINIHHVQKRIKIFLPHSIEKDS